MISELVYNATGIEIRVFAKELSESSGDLVCIRLG